MRARLDLSMHSMELYSSDTSSSLPCTVMLVWLRSSILLLLEKGWRVGLCLSLSPQFPIFSYFLFCLGQLLCNEFTVTCSTTPPTTVQEVILQGIQRVEDRYTVQAFSSFHVNWQTKGVLVYHCWTFLSPMQSNIRMPDSSFESRVDFGTWPQRRWKSQHLLQKENCHIEWQGYIQETNYYAITQERQNILLVPWVPMHRRPREKRST